MTRRWGLIASGIATVILLLAMSPAEQRMKDSGGPGMVPFELTGGQDRADEILAEWGEDGQDAARESLWIDFGFLLAYGTFLSLALAASRDLARERDWRRLAAIGGAIVSFGALGAGFDALENICLLLTIEGCRGSLSPAGDDLRLLQVHPPHRGDRLSAGLPGHAAGQAWLSRPGLLSPDRRSVPGLRPQAPPSHPIPKVSSSIVTGSSFIAMGFLIAVYSNEGVEPTGPSKRNS